MKRAILCHGIRLTENPQKMILKFAEQKDTDSIVAVLHHHGSRLDAVTTSTAAHRLAKLFRGRKGFRAKQEKRRAVIALKAPLLRRMGEFGTQAMANSIWALATLECSDHRLFDELSEVAASHLGLFKGFHVSNFIWAFATLSKGDSPLLPLFSEEAALRAEQRELSPQSLANIVWGHAVLSSWHAALFESAAVAARDTATDFNPQDLSNTLWAFLMLPDPTVVQGPLFIAMATAALKIAGRLPPQDLTSIVWTFAEYRQRQRGARDLRGGQLLELSGLQVAASR